MEPPTSVYSLCKLYGCSLETLNIRCLFCRCFLSYQDLLSFTVKHLRIVLRDYSFFAACNTCLKLSAAYEQKTYCQCVATADFVKHMCNGNYCDLNVRCLTCMKRLDKIEVLESLEKDEQFYLVRCIWRTNCRLCKGENAW
uniref:Protein E6 n=1 Tax=Human papillomavirus TaxID=10566 RepID=A0A386AT57_9PAPI|nr:MAG: E6 protein [Human papillomavirus]